MDVFCCCKKTMQTHTTAGRAITSLDGSVQESAPISNFLLGSSSYSKAPKAHNDLEITLQEPNNRISAGNDNPNDCGEDTGTPAPVQNDESQIAPDESTTQDSKCNTELYTDDISENFEKEGSIENDCPKTSQNASNSGNGNHLYESLVWINRSDDVLIDGGEELQVPDNIRNEEILKMSDERHQALASMTNDETQEDETEDETQSTDYEDLPHGPADGNCCDTKIITGEEKTEETQETERMREAGQRRFNCPGLIRFILTVAETLSTKL
uniref:Uncharacterized protein n=1 Tax=Steinernema glaseri TaxID=37863 RepID=A0A1I7ZEM5_9BILA